MNYFIMYVILLEIMFNISSSEGNTGSVDYSKKNTLTYPSPSWILIILLFMGVYYIMYSSHKMDLRKNVDLNALYHASKEILKDGVYEG